MERVILHCDLNNFFASVSLLSHPSLLGEPIAVCGDKEKRHGIVLAKNDIAKKYGVKTAEPIWQAMKKCPELICLKPDYQEYMKYSRLAKNIYLKYTDMVESFGIDECWLDVTGSRLLFGDGETIANKIRNEIKNTLGITVSVGVSFNKIFAKLGSDMKKPDAVTVISPENFKEKIWHLNIEELLFVGKSTKERLNSAGIFSIGDVAECDEKILKRMLGKHGEELKKYATGLDDSAVADIKDVWLPKSISKSMTCSRDFDTEKSIWQMLTYISEDLSRQLISYSFYAKTVTLHIRDSELKVREISKTLSSPTCLATEISFAAMEIFKANFSFLNSYRSIGIRVSNLFDGYIGVQTDMFGEKENNEKEEIIEKRMYAIRDKYGNDAIRRGSVLDLEL